MNYKLLLLRGIKSEQDKILFSEKLNIEEIENLLSPYKSEMNKLSDNPAHQINAFIVFCLYKKARGELWKSQKFAAQQI